MSALSPMESDRFGYRVARAALSSGEVAGVRAILREDDPDVLIVRAPSDDPMLPAELAKLPGYVSITADMLMYWRWDAPDTFTALHVGSTTSPPDDAEELEQLVRDVFAGYTNHYAANPLFSAQAALDGYVEWTHRLVAGDASCLVLRGEAGDALGFGLIDWGVDVPDVRLAGIVQSARGRGAYRELVAHMMRAAVDRGRGALQISTQAHNTPVMRAWAAAGWRPMSTQTTFHVIRASLLAG